MRLCVGIGAIAQQQSCGSDAARLGGQVEWREAFIVDLIRVLSVSKEKVHRVNVIRLCGPVQSAGAQLIARPLVIRFVRRLAQGRHCQMFAQIALRLSGIVCT